jgi:hypothetical protein
LSQYSPIRIPRHVDENGTRALLIAGAEREEESFDDNVYEDSDTRDFYMCLPNLFELVPAILLGEAAMEHAKKMAEESAAKDAGNMARQCATLVTSCVLIIVFVLGRSDESCHGKACQT